VRAGEPVPHVPGRRKPIQHHRPELIQPVLSTTTDCDKKKVPAQLELRGRESLEQRSSPLMYDDSTPAQSREVETANGNAKKLNRLVQETANKLAGKDVTVKPPSDDAFRAGGVHEVWGTIARQAGKSAGGDATRDAITNALADYEAETQAEVWSRLNAVEDLDGDQFDTRRPPDSDQARGLVLLPHLIGRARWVEEWGATKDAHGWLFWDGKRWARTAAAVENLAKKILPREVAARWSNYDAAAEAAKRTNVINALWWIRTDPRVLAHVEELDANPWLLNVDNGTLDLATGILRPHSPADLITRLCPTKHDPAAECPLFRETLNKFQPDSEIQTFFSRHFGSALTGVVSHLKLPILYGVGNNGKSTFTNAMVHVMGSDYAAVLDAEILTDDGSKGGKSDRLYHVAKLHGMRLVIVNELEENCILRGSMLKSLVSTDKMTARRPYGMPFDFYPSHKLAMLTNHKPRLRSTDNGTMRRLALVPFEVQIQPGEDIKDFGERLQAESSGILNWLVEGCMDWQSQNKDAPVPDVIRAATEDYRHEEDLIGRFVADCIKQNPGGFVAGKVVHDTFKHWCESAGIEPMNGTAFGRKLLSIPWIKKSKSGTVKYTGIIINPDWDKGLLQSFE
jgi:putative DNA primase/helicase